MTKQVNLNGLLKKIFLILCASPLIAFAQEWPNKPITFVVPFPAGGGTDAFARPLATQLTKQLGKQIIIDNRGGAGGTLGASIASKAAPDGYSFFVGAAHHAIAPSMYPNLDYDIEKSFIPVAMIANPPQVIVVNPKNVQVKNLKEFIDLLKKNPGKFNYASTGNGTSQHLTGELFKMQNKLFITHIPYRGTGPALQDLVAGQVDMMFDTLAGAAPFIKSGQLIAVAVASSKRSDAFPNVPTAQELGISNFVVSSWYAMWAIKGTPKDIVEKMSAEVQTALASPEIKERWAGMGASVPKMSRAELATYVNQEIVRWSEVVKKSNAKLD